MSKRPLEESPSRGDSAPPEHLNHNQNHNGHLPINDLLSPTPDQGSSSSSKKPRNFIATVVSLAPNYSQRVKSNPSIGL